MKCPKCGFEEDKVVDSRVGREGASVRRRRECLECTHRFTTLEEILPTEIYVIKCDDNREEFDPQKLRVGIERALYKRPVREEQVEELLHQVIRRLEQLGEREIHSAAIGDIVMEELEQLDQVAYVRFASVYRQFKDIDQFIDEIRVLSEKRD